MNKILITGANGFIGKYVLDQLQPTYSLIAINQPKSTSKAKENIEADIADYDQLLKAAEALKDVDIIIHLAASLQMNNSEALIPVNCTGTANMLKLAKEINVKRFVYMSSIPVIGKPEFLPINESHPTNPRTVYHASKLFGENLTNIQMPENSIILRIPSPVGYGMNPKTILPFFLKSALADQDIILAGDGGRVQNYIDVRDISVAIERAVTSTHTGVFHIASAQSWSNRELAEKCIELSRSNSKIIKSGKTDPEEDFRWLINVNKAKEQLNFTTQFALEDTIYELMQKKELL